MKNKGDREIKTISVEELAIAPARDQTNSPQRILVVDDDFYVRELNAGVLLRFGYDVDTADNGADAWKAMNEVRYDLLITDNKMATVTGLELIKKLRSEDMTLPVILASGTVPTEELKRYPWLRLDATLPKPFTGEQLLETVKKVLSTTTQTPFADLMLHPEKLEAALKATKIPKAGIQTTGSTQKQIDPPKRIL